MKSLTLTLALLAAMLPAPNAFSQELTNRAYRVRMQTDGTVIVFANGTVGPRSFGPTFTIISRDDDPDYGLVLQKDCEFNIPAWASIQPNKRTRNLFEAGHVNSVTANQAEFKDGKILWHFAETPQFVLAAALELPPGDSEPKVSFRFTPKQSGWFSVGYTGAPEVTPAQLDSLWQPLVWQEKRFPSGSYLSIENMCPIPAVLASQKGSTFGVVADPDEIPYRAPTLRNSLFGVMLRNAAGNAQPMIFAPALGLPHSSMKAGEPYSFSFRLFLSQGDCIAAYRKLGRGLFGFRDQRENGTCSLNETLENMIEFAMNDQLAGWIPEQRGSDYSTDVPGSVKNVSALHPVSIALITDSPDIYRRRALPMTEYMMSRQKYLFAPRVEVKGQGASYLMKGPAAEVSELVSLHQMFQGQSEVFRHYALELYDKPRALNLHMVSEGASWQNSLALYRLTGDRKYLEKAIAGANDYVSRRIDHAQEDFSDVHVDTGGQFFSDFAPKWVDLFELYEETKDERHLKAAIAGANEYTTYVWLQPRIPDGDVVVNKGGQVGVYYSTRTPHPEPMRAPEQRVPAWRVSPIGLTPEASTTYKHNPSIFLAHYAAYMLRLGGLTDDSFFHDIARSAVVGRYASFPGYSSKGEYTTIYQQPDYARRPWHELTYNNIFYNHIWPNIALLMDYLVSDAEVKSRGQISFPSRYAQGYAYLQSKVYGDRPGVFMGDPDVRLWLPRKQLRLDTIQANYVAGYGRGNFYLALLNECNREQNVKVTLNPDVVPFNSGQTYQVRVWANNRPSAELAMRDGELTVPLAPGGITALKVEGLNIVSEFQDEVFAVSDAKPSAESFAVQDTPFGKVTSMLISMGPSITSAYVWLEAAPPQVTQATLHYKLGDRQKAVQDAIYPFEFSVPLAKEDREIEFWVETAGTNGAPMRAEKITLKR